MTVDVMLPYYGDVVMMKAAVDSVLAQTDGDLRLVVVDDGYPDPSLPGYFADLTDRDSRVTYLRNEENLGANANYRKCVSLVENPITVIMGADDIMLPDYVATVRAGFRDPDVAIVQPGVEVIDEHGRVYQPLADRVKTSLRRRAVGQSSAATLAGEAAAASLLTGDWLYFPSVAWRSDVLKRHSFQPQYEVVQDLALAIDVIVDGGKLLVTDRVSFQYRRHRASDSSVKALDGRRFAEERAFFDQCVEAFRARGWRTAERAARLHLTSRLHAATLLPKVASKRMWPGLARLGRHVVRP